MRTCACGLSFLLKLANFESRVWGRYLIFKMKDLSFETKRLLPTTTTQMEVKSALYSNSRNNLPRSVIT